MLIFLWVLFLVESKNSYCWDNQCYNCTDSKFNFAGASCLDVCPTFFSLDQSTSSCVGTTGSLRLFTIEFYLYLDYSTKTVKNFYHPMNQLFKNDQIGPIPTKDRGFYFSDTSRLLTDDKPILAPTFGLGIMLRVLSPGTIFTINMGAYIVFEMKAVDLEVQINYFVCNFTCNNQTRSINHYSKWIKLTINFIQSNSMLTVDMNYNKLYYYEEFRPSSNDNSYFFGKDSGGFKGFIYYFELRNKNSALDFNFNINSCTETQYYYEGSCLECPTDKLWPLCTFGNGVSCYSSNCTSCSGFGYQDCSNCGNSSPSPCILGKNCNVGNQFSCTQCESGFYNSNGVCILMPTPNRNPKKSIEIDFGYFLENNEYFEWPYNVLNGNESIPTPIRFRGHYFNGSAYLKNKVTILLNHSLTIAFWLYSQNSSTLLESSKVKITGSGDINITLSNKEDTKIVLSRDKLYPKLWYFFAAILKLENSTTTLLRFYNDKLETIYSIAGYALYDEAGQTFIGCSLDKTNCFVGFIHNMDLWQYDFGFTIDNRTLSCPDNTTNCLQVCEATQYFNTWENLCLSCNPECLYGCASWASCRKCNTTICVSCSRSYTGDCLIKTPSDGSCAAGLVLKNDTCCDNECSDCYGPYFFKCLKCHSRRFLHSNVCVDQCPTGYQKNVKSECVMIISLIMSYTFESIHSPNYDAYSKQPAKFGTDMQTISGNNETHPRPAAQRGYYFRSSSFATLPKVIIPVMATVTFFIYVEADGLIFSHGKMKWFSNGTIFYELRRNLNNFEKFYTNFFSASKIWIEYTLTVFKDIHGTTYIKLYKNHEEQAASYAFYLLYNPKPESVIIGLNTSTGFQGFLYSFKIYSVVLDTEQIKMITNTSLNLNLWTCEFNKYFDGSCKDCRSDCSTCVRSGDCVLCNDMKCKTCSSFTSACSECLANSILDISTGSCYCPDITVWNQSTSYCENCAPLCKSCSNSNCIECPNNALNIRGTCRCNNQFYQVNSTFCNTCDITCLECDGPSKRNCTTCVVNSKLTINNQCICDLGFFRNGFDCSPCHETCKTCEGAAFNQCLSCRVNLVLKSSSCVCPSKTYWNQLLFYCDSCEEDCLECKGNQFYQCSKCPDDFSMLAGYCSQLCPLGYLQSDGKCLEKYGVKAFIRFSFEEIKGVFYDEISNVRALTGTSLKFYLDADENDPIPTYKRGLYFTGNSSFLSFTSLEKQVLFGPDFSISFWIWPELQNFLIFQYYYNETLQFNISFEGLKMRTDFWLFGEKFYYLSSVKLELKEWNHLELVLEYSYLTEIHIVTNTFEGSRKSATSIPFKDFLNASFYIGSLLNSSNSFKGFLYSLEFYVRKPLLETLVYPGICENCLVCLSDGSCIPSCNLTEFPVLDRCSSCLELCTSGCRHNYSCNLCYDRNCLNCSNYQKNSCLDCQVGYELINNSCNKCENITYYNKTTKKCTPCEGLCKTCLSQTECTSCTSHSSLSQQSKCLCDVGYYAVIGCERKRFIALISIDFQNKVKISFTEELMIPLKNDDAEILVNSENINFEIENIDAFNYHFLCNFSKKVKKGDKLDFRFKNQLVSGKNSLLLTENLTITLNYEESKNLDEMAQAVQSFVSDRVKSSKSIKFIDNGNQYETP